MVIHGIPGIVYLKKKKKKQKTKKNSVPIFTSKCAEMYSNEAHLLEELDRDLATFFSCLNQRIVA